MKFFILLLFTTYLLSAHQLRENYLSVDFDDSTKVLKMTLKVETRLLENNSSIDDNKNEIVSFKELRAHQDYLVGYTQNHFNLFFLDRKLSILDSKVSFNRYQDQTYMTLTKRFNEINLDLLVLKYSMFFELEDIHKLLIHLNDKRGDYILDKSNAEYSFSSLRMSEIQRLYIFIKDGISHILDGLDHLLFVLMLLIPTLITLHLKSNNHNIKSLGFSLLKIITTFSVAHSLTLFISAMGFWRPNIEFIESSIAFSIFVVALMNFLGKYNHVNYKIVFLFGLLHGFGFANVLEIVQMDNIFSFLVALFGFNLGVELGQIFVIALVAPFLYLISKTKHCVSIIKVVSFGAMLLAVYWFLQRVGLL